jgi:hypothetical protein
MAADKYPNELTMTTGEALTDAAVIIVQLEGETVVKGITYRELCDRILADLGPVVAP